MRQSLDRRSPFARPVENPSFPKNSPRDENDTVPAVICCTHVVITSGIAGRADGVIWRAVAREDGA